MSILKFCTILSFILPSSSAVTQLILGMLLVVLLVVLDALKKGKSGGAEIP